MRILLLLLIGSFLSNCSNAAKPEADPNQDPNYQEAAPQEEVSIKGSKPEIEYERTTSSQDFVTEDNIPKDVYYQAALGPFFTVSAFVPYRVKLDFEQQIYKVRNAINTDKNLRILILSYYPKDNVKEKRFAERRAKNLIEYASWKEKVDKTHFVVKLVPTTEEDNYYMIGFELNIPKGGSERKTTTRTVYYTGQRAKTKMPEQTETESSQDSSAQDLSTDSDSTEE